MTICNSGAGRCCGGICDASLENSEFASECRSGPTCSGTTWQYNSANEGATCPTGVCSAGLCEAQVVVGVIYSVSERQLELGYNRVYSSGDKLKTTLEGESFAVAMSIINSTAVKITVGSTPQQTLSIRETKKVSISGGNNLAITLYGITGTGSTARANITMKVMGENTCEESWKCGEWGKCSGGKQKRSCTDSNNCGTQNTKPKIEQSCNGGSGKKLIYIFLVIIVIVLLIVLFVIWRKRRNSLPTQANPPVISPPRSYPPGYN
jgi:hypothetical protein